MTTGQAPLFLVEQPGLRIIKIYIDIMPCIARMKGALADHDGRLFAENTHGSFPDIDLLQFPLAFPEIPEHLFFGLGHGIGMNEDQPVMEERPQLVQVFRIEVIEFFSGQTEHGVLLFRKDLCVRLGQPGQQKKQEYQGFHGFKIYRFWVLDDGAIPPI
jgi:hypothetical protein